MGERFAKVGYFHLHCTVAVNKRERENSSNSSVKIIQRKAAGRLTIEVATVQEIYFGDKAVVIIGETLQVNSVNNLTNRYHHETFIVDYLH